MGRKQKSNTNIKLIVLPVDKKGQGIIYVYRHIIGMLDNRFVPSNNVYRLYLSHINLYYLTV